MAIQLSIACRNARLDQFETSVGTGGFLKIFTGAAPTNCQAADSGTVLATVSLPSDFMNAASGGTKTLNGTWEDTSADGTGTAAHFRVYDEDGSPATCHMQGTVGTSGTDMIVDSTSFTAGQSFSVTTFTLTDGNA